jgi:hypothetical protein
LQTPSTPFLITTLEQFTSVKRSLNEAEDILKPKEFGPGTGEEIWLSIGFKNQSTKSPILNGIILSLE